MLALPVCYVTLDRLSSPKEDIVYYQVITPCGWMRSSSPTGRVIRVVVMLDFAVGRGYPPNGRIRLSGHMIRLVRNQGKQRDEVIRPYYFIFC